MCVLICMLYICEWQMVRFDEWIEREFIEYNPLCKHKMRFKSPNSTAQAEAATATHVLLQLIGPPTHFSIRMMLNIRFTTCQPIVDTI